MASREVISEKVQEAIFNDVLSRVENRECADCKNKSPTWASIDFGVLVCIRCSGFHRNLGPSITRVRSTKLDSWEKKQVEIMQNVGNKLANDFWEYKIPKSFKRLDNSASPEECKRFVNEKYIRKSYAPQGHTDPVKEYLEAVKNGTFIDKRKEEKSKQKEKEAITVNESPAKRKRSISLEKDKPTKSLPSGSKNNSSNGQTKQIDLLWGDDSNDGFNEFKVAPTNTNSNGNSNNSTANSTNAGKQTNGWANFEPSTNGKNSTVTAPSNKQSNQFDLFDFSSPVVQNPLPTNNITPQPDIGFSQPEPIPEVKKMDILSLYSNQPQPVKPNGMNQNAFMNPNYNNFNGMMYNQPQPQTNGFNYSGNTGMGYQNGMMGAMNTMNGMNQNTYGNGYSNGTVGYGGGMMNNATPNMNQFQNGYNGGQMGYNNFQGGFNTPNVGVNQFGQVPNSSGAVNVQNLYGNKYM